MHQQRVLSVNHVYLLKVFKSRLSSQPYSYFADSVYQVMALLYCQIILVLFFVLFVMHLQCFDAVGWWGAGVVIIMIIKGIYIAQVRKARCRLAYGPADATATCSPLLQ